MSHPGGLIGSAADALAEARWLTAARVTAYSRLLFGLTLLLALGWVLTSHGGLDRLGKPLGTDFVSFWAASRLALTGHAPLVYDIAAHQGAERAAFPLSRLGYEAFFYPPTYLLICLPLALAPYGVALAAWLSAGAYACWRGLRALMAPVGAGLVVALFAFPGVFSNVAHGQNAFLTTALFAAGAVLMDRRPVLAGVLLGLLAIKPHLGVVLPIGLMAAGRWRTILGAAVGVAALTGASVLVFGPGIWLDYLHVAPLAGRALAEGWVPIGDMQSAFAAVRVAHGPLGLAWAVQLVVAVAACAALIWAVRRRPKLDGRALVALIVAATLLSTPFLLDYDLMLVAVPLAWVAREALIGGFLRWEKVVIAAAFILPLVSRSLARLLDLPIAPLVLAFVCAVVVRRVLNAAASAPQATAGRSLSLIPA